MRKYEYKVVPAPRRSDRMDGLTDGDDPYSMTVASVMNDFGRGGWEYLQSEHLPCQRRRWWIFGWTTEERDVLVFRRAVETRSEAAADITAETARIRARRVRNKELVDQVQAGKRRIQVARSERQAPLTLTGPTNLIDEDSLPNVAAE
ncbi:MAG: hypothetical protein AAFR35_04425 [Pseudomonadota bacterium]